VNPNLEQGPPAKIYSAKIRPNANNQGRKSNSDRTGLVKPLFEIIYQTLSFSLPEIIV